MSQPCRRDRFCRSRDPRTQEPAPATDRGLCLPCEAHGRDAIASLPEDYVLLKTSLAASTAVSNSGIRVRAVEAPIPLRVDVEALMRTIAGTLVEWERDVRYAARLSPIPDGGIRDGTAVARGAATLVTHYSALLALRLPASAQDGVDGVNALTDLHHASLSLVGAARAWEWRELNCPSEPLSDGCGKGLLGRWLGDERVMCPLCQWSCTMDDYAIYVMTFIPPKRRI